MAANNVRERIWNLQSDHVHTQLGQLPCCIHLISFGLNFITSSMKVVFLTSEPLSEDSEKLTGLSRNVCRL